MNAEKELLLALLIEKHSEHRQAVKIVKTSQPQKRKRRTRNPHRWTESEKQFILQGQKENKSLASMALALNLRPKQVDNMLYSLNQRQNEQYLERRKKELGL